MAASSPPLVTIGVPVYNSEKYLPQALDSLLGQTYGDFVMVICDNASTDGTAAICRDYAERDSRVQYHRNPVNIGMSGNFNRVFSFVKTKYIKWSTADDYSAREMLADAVPVMEADSTIAVCYPQTVMVDRDSNVIDNLDADLHLMQDDPVDRFLELIARITFVNQHLGLVRSDMVRRTRLFGPHVSADIGFLAELSLYGKFHQMRKRQFFRRFHEDSSSWNRGDQEQEARRFHAANVRRIPFNTWRYYATFQRAVLRSPLSLRKKALLLDRVVRMMYWARTSLVDDLRRDIPPALYLARRP